MNRLTKSSCAELNVKTSTVSDVENNENKSKALNPLTLAKGKVYATNGSGGLLPTFQHTFQPLMATKDCPANVSKLPQSNTLTLVMASNGGFHVKQRNHSSFLNNILTAACFSLGLLFEDINYVGNPPIESGGYLHSGSNPSVVPSIVR